jgi:hypothetical protein
LHLQAVFGWGVVFLNFFETNRVIPIEKQTAFRTEGQRLWESGDRETNRNKGTKVNYPIHASARDAHI